jgi:ribosome-associated protein
VPETTTHTPRRTPRLLPGDLVVRVDTPGGPGGQHANRTKSRVTVEVDLRTATSFDAATRARLREVFGDVVRATSSASRRQSDNRVAAEERLVRRLEAALHAPTPRTKTKPKRSAVERRLADKKRRGAVKRLRNELDD